MPQARISELEGQLAVATATIAQLNATNLELTRGLSDADSRNKKLRRGARRDESSLKEQLLVAQSRRG